MLSNKKALQPRSTVAPSKKDVAISSINKEVKDESYYTEQLKKIFNCSKPDLYGLLVNVEDKHKYEAPEYDTEVNYSKSALNLSKYIQDNLNLLKSHCLDLTMINDYIKQYQDDKTSQIDTESKEMDVLSNAQSKKRRTVSTASKNFMCPFKGCDKQYLTSTSLKLHCKRVHCDDEPLKEDYSMKSPIKKHKRGVDLTKVFKPEDLKRLQYNIDEDIVGSLFDGLTTNTN